MQLSVTTANLHLVAHTGLRWACADICCQGLARVAHPTHARVSSLVRNFAHMPSAGVRAHSCVVVLCSHAWAAGGRSATHVVAVPDVRTRIGILPKGAQRLRHPPPGWHTVSARCEQPPLRRNWREGALLCGVRCGSCGRGRGRGTPLLEALLQFCDLALSGATPAFQQQHIREDTRVCHRWQPGT